MKFLAYFALSLLFCLIEVESLNLEKFLFPRGFDKNGKLNRQKRAISSDNSDNYNTNYLSDTKILSQSDSSYRK